VPAEEFLNAVTILRSRYFATSARYFFADIEVDNTVRLVVFAVPVVF
jgi:hypothetical protein